MTEEQEDLPLHEDQVRPIQRDEIQLISRYSNWSERQIGQSLREHVYNGPQAWIRFLKICFISLGVCFTVSGVIFFFAYNWADLSNFTKIAMLESLVAVTTLATLLLRINLLFRNVILTGAAMLVGALFAVYGQIYQTGANAYDLFLAWTACIALWTAVSNFPPLWLVFIALVNTTFILFVIQVGQYWEGIGIFATLFSINAAFLAGLLACGHFMDGVSVPGWFRNTLGVVAAFYGTVGVCMGINRAFYNFYFRSGSGIFIVMLALAAVAYAGAMLYSFQKKNAFFIALVSTSVVIMLTTLITNLSSSSAVYLFASMFVIGGITGIIAWLLYLQKKWSDEK